MKDKSYRINVIMTMKYLFHMDIKTLGGVILVDNEERKTKCPILN